jgi:hypothetical protein
MQSIPIFKAGKVARFTPDFRQNSGNSCSKTGMLPRGVENNLNIEAKGSCGIF